LCAAFVSQVSCGPGWRRWDDDALLGAPSREQVEVWQADTAARWHGLVVTADSVSGIPFLKPLTCDSCRITVERSAVDSIRVGNPIGGFWRGVGWVVGTALVVCAFACPRAGN
jgi:hypothetical protein